MSSHATEPAPESVKALVRGYWEAEPCGTEHASSTEGTPEYFSEIERKRDELEPFIPAYADFASARGERVLEIGVGAATDFVRWARAGAQVTGVDLTEHALVLARRRLELEGLDGELRQADAERLPFPDDSFDVVYSWGVLHHTPNTPRAVAEALRVARPGGRVCIMLYARHSWLAWGLWVRHALLKGRPWRSVADVIHDHMESVGTTAYTTGEMRAMFGTALDELRVEHVGTPYDRAVAGPVAARTGRRLGWFLVARGVKAER